MQSVVQNLRYAWRQLRHSPEFTFIAVVTLALGIGANTAMFTVVESVLLRPLPYADSDRLVQIDATTTESSGSVSWLDYRDICDQARSLGPVAGYSNDVGVVQSKHGSVSVVASAVTTNLFSTLGVQPLLGRTFTKDEGQADGPQTVLLSQGLWRKVFQADPAIVGRSVRVNGRQRTVVGVMRNDFRFPESAGPDVQSGLWLPMAPTREMLKQRGYRFFMILAKAAPGVTVQQVHAELGSIARHIRETDAQANRSLTFRAISYRESITGPVRPVFLALVGALALVLLIACANVANLLMAGGLGRQHEFAVRAALGSGKSRLVGQIIAEAGLLSLLGCALGVVVACWIMAAVHRLPPGTIPRAEAIEVHWTVILALGAIVTVTTILSALLPALFFARTDLQPLLQASSSRSSGTNSVKARTARWLVAGEVALSALLLVATALMFQTLWKLEHVRLGFDTTRVTSFTAMPADATGFGNIGVTVANKVPVSAAITVYQPLLDGIRHAAGVQDAALVTAPPLSGVDLEAGFRVVASPNQSERAPQARLTAVSGDYERLMGTPVIRGRDIIERDTVNAPFVATINEALAQKYFAGKDPLGQEVDLGSEAGMSKPFTIVGVISNQIDASTSQLPQPLLMLPYQQIPTTSLFYPALITTVVHFVVKTRGDVPVAPTARAIFDRIAPDLALDNFQTMQEVVDQSNFGTRLGFYVIAAFAGLAIVMVVVGLYGVLAQFVSHRRREFGVRMALGATRQSIVLRILAQGSATIATGLAAGIFLAMSFGQLITRFLFGVKPLDGSTYLFVVIVLYLVGTLAALAPAWRAASFEPVKALRDE